MFISASIFYKKVLEQSPVRIVVIEKSGKLVYANFIPPEVFSLLGGKTIYDFIPEEYHHISRENIKAVLEGKGPVSFNQWGEVDGKRLLNRNKMSLLEERGEEFVVVVFEDITEEWNKENEIRENEERKSALINATSDIVLSVDRNLNLIEFNQTLAEIYQRGFGKKLEKGQSVYEVFLPSDRLKMAGVYEKALCGERLKITDSFGGKSGMVYYETVYHPIYSNNEISGIAIYSRDITEHIRNKEKLQLALKEQDVLLHEIHHRVKNNLAMISSLLELHAFRAVNEQTLDLIRSAQLRIKSASLVHELLYNNSSLHYVDFRDYIFRLCEAVEMSMHDPKKNVHIHLVCDPLELNLDQGVPCGLLINELLTNAYKHAFSKKDEGNIYIRLIKEGDRVSIEVSDDGGALDPNFDPEEVVSTGMILILTLCQQLEGNFTFSGGKTTSFKVEFENRNLLHESTDR